jgi:hypothetical protein
VAWLPISEGIFTNRYQDSHHFRQRVARKATMPMLSAIFMGAFFQLPSRGSSQVMSTLNVFLLLTVSIAAFGLFAGYMLARR